MTVDNRTITEAEIERIAHYLSTPEGKNVFRALSNEDHAGYSQGWGLPRDTSNGFALKRVARMNGCHAYISIETLQDSFEWRRIARTKDAGKIANYLKGILL